MIPWLAVPLHDRVCRGGTHVVEIGLPQRWDFWNGDLVLPMIDFRARFPPRTLHESRRLNFESVSRISSLLARGWLDSIRRLKLYLGREGCRPNKWPQRCLVFADPKSHMLRLLSALRNSWHG